MRHIYPTTSAEYQYSWYQHICATYLQPTRPYLYVKSLLITTLLILLQQPVDPLPGIASASVDSQSILRWPTQAFTSETDSVALSFCFADNTEKGVILPSGKEGGWSSSGLTEARKAWLVAGASQAWRKTVRRLKCLQIPAQGQVEGPGLGRQWGHITVNQKATRPDGAEQVWAGTAHVHV